MKKAIHALAMCQSMFCAIPFPGHIWDEEARDRMLLFLPLVGLEIGALWVGLAWLCQSLAIPALIRGAILGFYPYLVTGFLHLDGFMDVTDAVRSWRDLARRREILKDSHVGSFAVIGITLVLLAQFAAMASAPESARCGILLLVPMVSRCCSALAVTALPPMSTSQYAGQKAPGWHLAVLLCQGAAAIGCGFLFWEKYGLVLLGCAGGYALALRRGYRSLQGMNGDISGYALTLGELCALAVYALI